MKKEPRASDFGSIDAIIAAAYDVISGPAGKKRDWDRERSLFYPGARLIPTAKPGRNDALMPQILDVDGFIARAEPLFLRNMDSTKKKLRVAPNNSAVSLTSGARTNRVTTRATLNRSCAGSIAFNFSTTEGVGGL